MPLTSTQRKTLTAHADADWWCCPRGVGQSIAALARQLEEGEVDLAAELGRDVVLYSAEVRVRRQGKRSGKVTVYAVVPAGVKAPPLDTSRIHPVTPDGRLLVPQLQLEDPAARSDAAIIAAQEQTLRTTRRRLLGALRQERAMRERIEQALDGTEPPPGSHRVARKAWDLRERHDAVETQASALAGVLNGERQTSAELRREMLAVWRRLQGQRDRLDAVSEILQALAEITSGSAQVLAQIVGEQVEAVAEQLTACERQSVPPGVQAPGPRPVECAA